MKGIPRERYRCILERRAEEDAFFAKNYYMYSHIQKFEELT